MTDDRRSEREFVEPEDHDQYDDAWERYSQHLEQQTCESCCFSAEVTMANGDDRRQCRFNPPVIVRSDAESYRSSGSFPIVGDGEWCGRWRQG